MSVSFLLTIYFIFLFIYFIVMSFAVYKVFMFAKNRELKGYSRRMTLVFLIVTFFIFLISLFAIRGYRWNDNFNYYCKKLSPNSCFCEPTSEQQQSCADEKNKEAQTKKENNNLPKK